MNSPEMKMAILERMLLATDKTEGIPQEIKDKIKKFIRNDFNVDPEDKWRDRDNINHMYNWSRTARFIGCEDSHLEMIYRTEGKLKLEAEL